MDALNNKGQAALNILQDPNLKEILKSFKPNIDNDPNRQEPQETFNMENLNLVDAREGYNLTEVSKSPAKNDHQSNKSRHRSNRALNIGNTSQENSPNHKNLYQNDHAGNKPVECLVCSELSEENVTLEPCNHKPACEDCSSRMKKCLQCGVLVQKRVTKDGRIIPGEYISVKFL